MLGGPQAWKLQREGLNLGSPALESLCWCMSLEEVAFGLRAPEPGVGVGPGGVAGDRGGLPASEEEEEL